MYFHKLLNEDGDKGIVLGDLEHFESQRYFGYCWSIKVEEVKRATHRRMSMGKETVPDEISMEFWKCIGRVGLEWLTEEFNVIFKMMKMPEEWRWSTMILLSRTRVIFKIAITIGDQAAKPHYGSLGESGRDEGEECVYFRRTSLD